MGNSLIADLIMRLTDDVSKPARTVAMALKDVEANIKAVAAGMGGAGAASSNKFVASLAKLKLSAKDIEVVSGAWRGYSKSAMLAADASQWTKTQAAGVRAWETQTLSALRAVEAEQRRYAASLKTIAAAPAGPGMLRRMGGNIVGGVGGMMAGMGAMVLGKDALKAGATLQGEQIKMIAAGIKGAELDAAQTQALKLAAQSPGVSIAAIEESYRGLRGVVANPASLPAMMPAIAEAMSAMNALDPSGEMAGKIQDMVKAAEVLGETSSPKRFAAYLDAVIRAQQVLGKEISPDAVLAVAKSLRAAGVTVSDRFKTTTALMLGDELGPKIGMAIDTFEKGLALPTGAAAKELVRLGLAKPDDFAAAGGGGRRGGGGRGALGAFKPGAKVAGGDLAATDPDTWVTDVFLPALKKAGVVTVDDQIAEARRMFSGRASDFVAKMIEQQEEIAATTAKFAAAQGLDAAKLNMESASTALGALKTSLTDFGAVLTSPMMKAAAGAMGQFRDWVGDITKVYSAWAKDHPEAAGGVGGAVGVATLAGAPLLAYGMLGNLASGFGLKGSAVALDESATALTVAAAKLGGGSALGDVANLKSPKGGGWLAGVMAGIFGTSVVAGVSAGSLNYGEGSGNDAVRRIAAQVDKENGVSNDPKTLVADLKRMAIASPFSVPQPLNDLRGESGAGPSWGQVPPPLGGGRDALKGPKPAEALDELNTTVRPYVDLSSLDAAVAKIAAGPRWGQVPPPLGGGRDASKSEPTAADSAAIPAAQPLNDLLADFIRRLQREPSRADKAAIASSRTAPAIPLNVPQPLNDLRGESGAGPSWGQIPPPLGGGRDALKGLKPAAEEGKAAIAGAQPLNDLRGESGAQNWGPGDRNPLARIKPAAAESKEALDTLNATVRPYVDLSSLDAALAKIAAVRDSLASLGSEAAGAGSNILAHIPALGATTRGNFTSSGWHGGS